MVHVFLRNVFWILPLFLVLVPDSSSVCMDTIRNGYQNIVSNSISYLTEKLGRNSPTIVSCNITKENITGRNAAPCKCCCNSNKERALRCMAQCLKNISKSCFSHSELQGNMDDVSNGSLELLKQGCNTTVQKPQKRRCRQHRNGCQTSDIVCYTKKIVSDLQICWMEFIR